MCRPITILSCPARPNMTLCGQPSWWCVERIGEILGLRVQHSDGFFEKLQFLFGKIL